MAVLKNEFLFAQLRDWVDLTYAIIALSSFSA